jgi:hypothetical protein
METVPEMADWHNIEEWNKEYPEVGDLVKLEEHPRHIGIVLDILDITVPAIAEVMIMTSSEGVQIDEFYTDQLEVIQQESRECQT